MVGSGVVAEYVRGGGIRVGWWGEGVGGRVAW